MSRRGFLDHSLDAGRAAAEPLADRDHAQPLIPQLEDGVVGSAEGTLAAEVLALGPGPSQPGVDPLLEHGPLELGEDAAHLEQGSAGGGAGVDVLLVKVEVDAEGLRSQSPTVALTLT